MQICDFNVNLLRNNHKIQLVHKYDIKKKNGIPNFSKN